MGRDADPTQYSTNHRASPQTREKKGGKPTYRSSRSVADTDMPGTGGSALSHSSSSFPSRRRATGDSVLAVGSAAARGGPLPPPLLMAAAEGGGERGRASPSRHRECRGSGKGRGAVTSTPAAVPAGAPRVAAPNDRRRDKRKTQGAPLQRPGAKPLPHPNERARPRPPHHGVEQPAGAGRRTRTPVPVRKKGGLNHLAQRCGWKEPTADGRQGDTLTKNRHPPHKKNQIPQTIDRVRSEEQKRGEKGNWRRRRHVTKRSLGLPAIKNTHARRGQRQRRCDGGAATIQTPSTADREGRGGAQEAEAAAERETGRAARRGRAEVPPHGAPCA